MIKMWSIVVTLMISAVATEKQSENLVVTDDVASFIAYVMANVFNATRVEVVVASEYIHTTNKVIWKLHIRSIVTTTVHVKSRMTSRNFVKRVYHGMPSKTHFYVVCLLSQQEYLEYISPEVNSVWTHLVYSSWIVFGSGGAFCGFILQQKPCTFYSLTTTKQGYALLGPSIAKRNNCSGVMTIARSEDGVTHTMETSPAKEEPSNVLTLACGPEGAHGVTGPCCSHPELEHTLHIIANFLNITHFVNVTPQIPLTPDDEFPAQGTGSDCLIRGDADIALFYFVMNGHCAFSLDFGFTLDFYKIGHLYPSPKTLRSTFTVLKIFSFMTWCFWGMFFGLITFVLRVVSYIGHRSLWCSAADTTISSFPNKVATKNEKSGVRTTRLGYYLLIFMIEQSFMGAYISFLNKPIMEEVPDTKDKLLAFLRDGRLPPCVLEHSLEHAFMTTLEHPSMMLLKQAVRNWTQFAEHTMEECAERARQRHAVYLGQLWVLERFAASFQGQVQVSRAYSEDLISPASLIIPKASPYKEVLDNLVMRLVEAGLLKESRDRYWKRILGTPVSSPGESPWNLLQLDECMLFFIILVAGLGASCMTFAYEIRRSASRTRRRYSPERNRADSGSYPVLQK